jgi:hypothetical protein
MTARSAVVVGTLAGFLAFVPGCGRISHHLSGNSAPTRKGTISAAPPTGTVGTTFVLTAGGLKPGEPMTFEIDPPKGNRFIGPSHTAAPDGTVTSNYKPQPGNVPGPYRIKVAGSQGTRAEGQLTLVAPGK